jgi:hypothetical protein
MKARGFMKAKGFTGFKNPNPLYKKVLYELILKKCQLITLVGRKINRKNKSKHAFPAIRCKTSKVPST